MEAQNENKAHCSAVRNSESTDARKSASCSLSPAHTHINNMSQTNTPSPITVNRTGVRLWHVFGFIVLQCVTWGTRLALMSVHDEAVPGSTQHPTELSYSEGVDVLAHCEDTRANMTQFVRTQQQQNVNTSGD